MSEPLPSHSPSPPAAAPASAPPAEAHHGAPHPGSGHLGPGELTKLSLGALGVVYGDIGTSPLYAIKECFDREHGVAVTQAGVLGILSLVFWSLTLVIVVKYLSFVMRADNEGEGGTFALLALLDPKRLEQARMGMALLLLGIFGAALLSGDGIITPAISVLSAVEGLGVATTALGDYVVPISVVILIALFTIQKRGTGKVGAIFGPTMLVWFAAIAVIGLRWIVRRPDVLAAVNPIHAARFMREHGWHGFFVLGSVVLCITGGEALYADMGHFGRRPIRVAWYAVVFPGLLANYFGQGALLLERGEVQHPFFDLVEGMWRFPLVLIATIAAVIASQALISGSFSLARSAVQLGFFPRLTIKHTSSSSLGQIYVPEINWALMVACVILVLGFRSSSSLAAAYSIAVTGTMAITSILFYEVVRTRWGWSRLTAGALLALFLAIDLPFLFANTHKIVSGGWVPLVIGAAVYTVMVTWKRGRKLLAESFGKHALPLDLFMTDVETSRPYRVRGTAVFMTSSSTGAPLVLLHHFKHNKVLHEQVLLLSIGTEQVPEVPRSARIVELVDLGQGFYRVRAVYGFMESPNVLELMDLIAEKGLETRNTDTSFFLGRETLIIRHTGGMARWRKLLFTFMSLNARTATQFFHIPPNRVVELGTQIEL